MAVADTVVQPQYEMDLPPRRDPYAPEVTGKPAPGRQAENDFCPFTGADPVHPVEIGGRVLGFGDAFTAAKVAADPLAWPEVADLLERRIA
jgi:glutathione S-transferase